MQNMNSLLDLEYFKQIGKRLCSMRFDIFEMLPDLFILILDYEN